MSNPLLEQRIKDAIQKRAEALLPHMIYDETLPLTEKIAELEKEAENLKSEVEWLEQRVAELLNRPSRAERTRTYEYRELSPDWERRRDRENGKPRMNNCKDCGEVCRGVRCLPCHKAKGLFGARRVAT